MEIIVDKPEETLLDFSRAIESAIFAKLAAKELPEPVSAQFQTLNKSDWHNFIDAKHQAATEADGRWTIRHLYTAAQLQQAHAQGFAAGAASQLAEKPSAKQFQTSDGGWHPFLDLQHEKNTVEDGRWPIRELYTRREAK